MSSQVLIVDDEKNLTLVIQTVLSRAGVASQVFNDSREALKFLKDPVRAATLQALITDLSMPYLTGMELLEYCKKHLPQLPVVMITAYGTVESAVNALKLGAFDYITKPFEQVELLQVVRKAIATHQRRSEDLAVASSSPEEILPSALSMQSMIGESPQMKEVFRVIQKIARSPSTVLITGESGTGKELVALEVHRRSDRSEKPFIKVNCAAIPATLIESELFGHEKGAFTGATASKPGRFELAHTGTLFLDEVADMGLEMQVKLLRALQEMEFERVGGVTTIKVDVRIVAATNKDLATEIKAGRFREDLFYRLNVVPIQLPSLRDRKEDIELLVGFFLTRFNDKLKKQIQGVSRQAMDVLRSFSWPGNIRQLENVLERSVLMSEGEILKLKDLPPEFSVGTVTQDESSAPMNFKEIVRKQTQTLERELIESALDAANGNVTKTAEKLGLSRKGLQLKMKELGVKRSTENDTENGGEGESAISISRGRSHE